MADNIIADISSIIPRMIFGITLIIAWGPVIFFTEKNNKGNRDEYKLLLNKIKDAKFIDVSSKVTYSPISTLTSYKFDNYDFRNDLEKYKNLLIMNQKKIKKIDSNGKINHSYESATYTELNIPLIDNVVMDKVNYTYLASSNKVVGMTVDDPTNSNITYEISAYAIPLNSQILKLERLKEYSKELDTSLYDYEFGPESVAIEKIKNRKIGMNSLQVWLGRIGTFLMLFGGLMLIIAPLQSIVNMGEALPGPLSLLAIPGKILLNVYGSFSFIGALILTLLMTLLMWSLVNYPLISLLIGGLLIGLMMFFGKK